MKIVTFLTIFATQSALAFAGDAAEHFKPSLMECKITYRLEDKTKVSVTLSGEDSDQELSVPMDRSFMLGGIDAKIFVARNLRTGKFTAHYIHLPSVTVLTAGGTASEGDSFQLRANQLKIPGVKEVMIDCEIYSARLGN